METLENSTVAALVASFNTAAVAVMALFAAWGGVIVYRRLVSRRGGAGGRKKNVPRGNILPSAFCAAALVAFALEATAFNFQSYLKLFAGPEIETLGASPQNPNVVLASGGAVAEIIVEDTGKPTAAGGLLFKNLNRKVTSLFAELDFGNAETMEMIAQWTDEAGTQSFTKKIYKRFPHDNYMPLQPSGAVSELKITFKNGGNKGSADIQIERVTLNRRIPFYFSGLRIFAVSLLLFAAICLFRKEARGRAAYWLFDCKFDPASRAQNLTHALLVFLLIVFSYICANTGYTKSYFEYPVQQQYNKYLVDALANGRTWLNYGTPQNLLKAERPYDNNYRLTHGYKFNSDVMWDWTWYKGKFYCYFGVVPAVILYLPYKLVTGEYLSNNAGIFAFTAAIIVLTALLWRFCVRKYMPNMGFAFYTLSFLTLFFTCGIFAQLRLTRFYSIVQTGGLMFALAGCLLLLKSVENDKINRVKLFFACLCLALVAGCRPNMLFVSLLVPFVLWNYRSWKLLLFVAIPYLMVAVPLCAYNYVRFDSIFEFGVKYVLTGVDCSAVSRLNPVGKIFKTIWAFTSYLFAPNKYSLCFPFVECHPHTPNTVVLGLAHQIQPGFGIANFPIVFCLPYVLKKGLPYPIRRMSRFFIIVAAVIVIADSFIMGVSGRYILDFAIFMILPSLFCAYSWCASSDGARQNKNRLSVVYALLAVSIFIGLFLFVTGTYVDGHGMQPTYDPVLYRYLEYSLGILRNA